MSYEISFSRKKLMILLGLFFLIIVLIFFSGVVISMMLATPETIVRVEQAPPPPPKVVLRMKVCPPCKQAEEPAPEAVEEAKPPEAASPDKEIEPQADKAEPPPPEPQPKKESPHGYPYSLKLDSFKTLERVEKALKQYNKKGLAPYAVKVDLGDKGVWRRIYLGAYESKEEALKAKQAFGLERAAVKRIKYANLIGVYENEKALEDKALELMELGYYTYALPGPDSSVKLVAGAFLSKSGVMSQHKELASHDIEAEVISR